MLNSLSIKIGGGQFTTMTLLFLDSNQITTCTPMYLIWREIDWGEIVRSKSGALERVNRSGGQEWGERVVS